ncbi:MAG: hypothetical protein OXH75_20715 [Acidobacteria bacterium]|nr:hypothetical protein [Acidobacteriota bacterium]
MNAGFSAPGSWQAGTLYHRVTWSRPRTSQAFHRGAIDRKQDPLPAFASALHRDARAPVSLSPIAGLRRLPTCGAMRAGLTLRAVRESVLRHDREGRIA